MGENNSYLLLEGKRDNQLIPYLQAFNEKTGKNLSLGQFKTMMLRKLSFEGGIHNVSLQSNYYLAGGVRYYFEGLLTNNKDLSVYKEENAVDDWNVQICRSLDALILVLRNGFIDSIGTSWLEPEDFGTLKLADLFKKYKKEIKKVIDKQTKSPEVNAAPAEEFKDYEMQNPEYGYDIIYDYSDATKYNGATSPGAWCITYGQNHLRYYTSQGNGHFVIFYKKGYENIPREKQEEKWINDKPQDDYGNSLIAYLQSNKGPGPADYGGAPLITSRWNHGSNGISCEADRAYTQEEFQRITGVSNEDLKGIYETWLHNKSYVAEYNEDSDRKATRFKLTPDELRILKYVQIRINGGEDPANFLHGYSPKEPVCVCGFDFNTRDEWVSVLVSGKKIFLETACEQGDLYSIWSNKTLTKFRCGADEKSILFNKLTKSLVNVQDQWLFKATPGYCPGDEGYLEVKISNKDIALVDAKTGKPVRLPNGQCWFNRIEGEGHESNEHGKVVAGCFNKRYIYEITYDMSSGEKYFFNTRTGQFININNETDKPYVYLKSRLYPGADLLPIIFSNSDNRHSWWWHSGPTDLEYIYGADGNYDEYVFEFEGRKYKIGEAGPNDAYKIGFDNIQNVTDSKGLVKILIQSEANNYSYRKVVIYDIPHKRLVKDINGNIFTTTYDHRQSYDTSVRGNENFIFIRRDIGYGNGWSSSGVYYIYDSDNDVYIKNPYEYPSEMEWEVSDLHVYKINRYMADVEIKHVVPWLSRLGNSEENWPIYTREKKEATRYIDPKSGNIYKYYYGEDEANLVPDYNVYISDWSNNENQETQALNENAGLLLEGKRDNQLIPYLQAFNEKTGKNLSLGEFKTMMLRKLSFEGGIHNVSLQSNYYLVGAIRYYFEGLLTNNKDLSVYKDENASDTWNVQVCASLNALIMVLRNAYIDTVGTEWIEPEDFGTMNLPDLFKKYKKEIKKLINKQNEPEKTEEIVPDYVMNNSEYGYDIIYNFNDAEKYCNATSPGSWCITYGSNHLAYYTERGHGHFVVFYKKNYESIPRKKQAGKWKGDKPQDDYGNSLIAYLQANNGPGPANYGGAPLITSRWNHGANNIYCEADRAYTQAEFQRITGVSDEDLKGIYETWKRNKDSRCNRETSGTVKVTPDEVRYIKYIQMRINGGENPVNLLMGYKTDSLWNMPTVKIGDQEVEFLMCDKKIFFETITHEFYTRRNSGHNFHTFANHKGYYILGHDKTKSIINIGGKFLFKAIGNITSDNIAYLGIRNTNTEQALINLKTGKPVQLPNGQYWFNEIHGSGALLYGCGEYRHRRMIGFSVGKDNGIIELVYDSSSNEKYFMETGSGKFIDFGQNEIARTGGTFYLYTGYHSYCVNGIVPMIYSNDGIRNRTLDSHLLENQILYKDGKPYVCEFELNGVKCKIGNAGSEDAAQANFSTLREVNTNGLFEACIDTDDTVDYFLVNMSTCETFKTPDGKDYVNKVPYSRRYYSDIEYGRKGEIFLPIKEIKFNEDSYDTIYEWYYYDSDKNQFLENPTNYPSHNTFYCDDIISQTGEDDSYIEFLIGMPPSWDNRDRDDYEDEVKKVTRWLNKNDGRVYYETEVNGEESLLLDPRYAPRNNAEEKTSELLAEGKRDNQLIPYWEIYNQKSENKLSLGQFKTMMLQKLSSEGNIHNLSLASNFYLVGAVKYYFNGDLTLNKDFSVFTDPTQPDQWNLDNCAKLNALILVLRNEYIGTVGTQWTEPEDFGTLPIKQLFKKYANRIKTVIKKGGDGTFDISQEKLEIVKPIFEDKDYDYDIIYNFADAEKYCTATSPGSWCITYGENHLKFYTRQGNGHFVIFKKKGYENIPRKKQAEKWIGDKPQDDYGNSLIAYLQSNEDGGPANYRGGPLITSRWNHGANGITCQADRAYTQEEFERITGYNRSDLDKIYEYWKKTKKEVNNEVRGKAPKEAILALKYLQMRLNGGENIVNNGSIKLEHDNIYSITFNGSIYYFLFNGKSIYFDTISKNDWELFRGSEDFENIEGYYSQIGGENDVFCIVYNTRLHRLLYVDDVCLFKDIGLGTNHNGSPVRYFEVAKSKKTIALLDTKTFNVVKMPNGQKWYNDLKSPGLNYRYGNRVHALSVHDGINCLCMVYDESSKESYFFNPMKNRFINAPELDGYYQICSDYSHMCIDLPPEYEFITYRNAYASYSWGTDVNIQYRITKNGEFSNFYTEIMGKTYKLFDDDNKNIKRLDILYNSSRQKLLHFSVQVNKKLTGYVVFNTESLEFLSHNGETILMELNREGEYLPNRLRDANIQFNNGKWIVCPLVLNIDGVVPRCDIVLNMEDDSLVENPLGFPSKNSFMFAPDYCYPSALRDKFIGFWKYNEPNRALQSGYKLSVEEGNKKFAYFLKEDGSYFENIYNNTLLSIIGDDATRQ